MSLPNSIPPAQVQQLLNEESANADTSVNERRFLDDRVERDIKLEYLRTLRQNNTERKKYAMYIYVLTCVWAALIFVILFLEGFGRTGFKLSDSLLITLVTTTTVNFFGFFLLVVKYLFNSDKQSRP